MKPLVSVIIPVFNKQNYVSEAIESVFAQTYAPIEIIAVNDGSTDNSLEVISRYLNDGIQVIDQKNSGVERARNLGFSKSVGSFIVFLDADDLMKSNRITKQIDLFISDPNLVLVGTWANVIDRSGNMVGSICPNTSNAAIQLGNLFRNQFVSSSVMVRRSAIADGLVFNESRGTRFAEDFDLWNRVSKKGLVANIPEKLTSYRRLEVSRSHSSAESLLESARDISAEWLHQNTNRFESIRSAHAFVMSINGLDDLSPSSGCDLKNTLETYDLVLSDLQLGELGQDSDEYSNVRKRHRVHIATWSLLGYVPLPIQRKCFTFLSSLKSWRFTAWLLNSIASHKSK
jgi:cellulose synthase/poly-beta-1,6-N-acetylglucosamine synthase-like glycosyltransferase